MRVMSVFGTRPEAIKMAPVVKALEGAEGVESLVCLTGQHREMLDQVVRLFGLTPDLDLQIMSRAKGLTQVTSAILTGMDRAIERLRPDMILVHGDTTTTMASALAAFYRGVPVGHVEAGLRTGNMRSPWPEEMNRKVTGVLGDLHFAPTDVAKANLLREGVGEGSIAVTGNTVIDALLLMAESAPDVQFDGLNWDQQRVILATVHRRENWGERLHDIAAGMLQVLERYPDTALLLPMHRNPTVREPLQALLGSHPRVVLTEPLDYDRLVAAMKGCCLLLTDSGGLQEEAPALGKPVLVLRRTTERPEAVDAGTARLVGTDPDVILEETSRLLGDATAYQEMSRAVNPFGDGHASERILERCRRQLGV